MQKHLALLVLAVFGSTIVLLLFAATSVFAQGTPFQRKRLDYRMIETKSVLLLPKGLLYYCAILEELGMIR